MGRSVLPVEQRGIEHELVGKLTEDGLLDQGVLEDGVKLGLIRQTFDVKAWFQPAFVQQAVKDLKLDKQWRETDAAGKAKGAA